MTWLRAALLVFALALQSFVAGSHIHLPAAGIHQQQQQPDNDPANCDVCKGLAAVGHAILPGAPLLYSPLVAIPMDQPPAVIAPAEKFLSHHWFGRGPPRA